VVLCAPVQIARSRAATHSDVGRWLRRLVSDGKTGCIAPTSRDLATAIVGRSMRSVSPMTAPTIALSSRSVPIARTNDWL
jgi:hypothetical protein